MAAAAADVEHISVVVADLLWYFCCVFLSSSSPFSQLHTLIASSGCTLNFLCGIETFPPACYLEEIPNIPITLVDGNVHKCAFSFVEFQKIWVKFSVHFNGNPATVTSLTGLWRVWPVNHHEFGRDLSRPFLVYFTVNGTIIYTLAIMPLNN